MVYDVKEGITWDVAALATLGSEFDINTLMRSQYHGTKPDGENILNYITFPTGASVVVSDSTVSGSNAEIIKAPWE